MKTKKFTKKLTLNKRTVSNLNADEMNAVHGGDETNEPTICVYTCNTRCNSNCCFKTLLECPL